MRMTSMRSSSGRTARWSAGIRRAGFSAILLTSTRLNPGDTVVVPEKVPRPSGLRNFIIYSQIFSH